MYIKRIDNTTVEYTELQVIYSSSSIPANGTLNILEYSFVQKTTQPVYNSQTEKLELGVPTESGGMYYENWLIIALTQPETDTRVDDARIVRKGEVKQDVLTQIDSFYQSEDLTQTRVRDQITSKYNTYSRLPAPTQDQIDYMTETDAVTDYTTSIYDDLVQAGIELDAMTTEQEVLDYVFVMPPLPTVTSYKLLALIGSMTE